MTIDRKAKITVSLGIIISSVFCIWHLASVFTEMQYDINYVKQAVGPIPQMEKDIATIKAVITSNPLTRE